MCKYCKLEEEGMTGEKFNDSPRIARLKDGCLCLDLMFNRYIIEDEDVHRAELILDMAVEANTSAYTIKEKHIAIRYCPFCGEKL